MVGSIAHAATIACLVYFIYTGYSVAINKQFISISSEDGDCEALSRENSGSYLATDTGFWEGTDGYKASLAIYHLEYYSYATTLEEYSSLIRSFKREMKLLGETAEKRDAAYNIMNWIAWELANPNYLFQLTGSSIDVFNRYYTIGNLATIEGVCDVDGIATYNAANYRLRLEYSVSAFRNSSLCMSTAHPYNLGFNENYDYDSFRIDLDLNSCLISVAVCCSVKITMRR